MKKNNLEITLGKDENNLVYRDSLFDICHILVGGTKDKGKDTLITNIIKDLIYYNQTEKFKIALCDFTRGDYSFVPKENLYVYPVATTISLAYETIIDVYHEAKRRINFLNISDTKDLTSYNKKYDLSIDSIVLIITEFSKLTEKEDFMKMISYILENGRICNIFVIIGTRVMTRKKVTKEFESLFPSKICFDTQTEAESNIIIEYKDAENLKENEFIYLTSSKTDYKKLTVL